MSQKTKAEASEAEAKHRVAAYAERLATGDTPKPMKMTKVAKLMARHLRDETMNVIIDKLVARAPLDLIEKQFIEPFPKLVPKLVRFKESGGSPASALAQPTPRREKRKKKSRLTRASPEPTTTATQSSGRPFTKSEREEFYASPAWRSLRYRALIKHKALCQCCGRGARDGVVIHVDHIRPMHHYPLLRLELSNLQILCADCNMGKGAWDETDWRPPDDTPPWE